VRAAVKDHDLYRLLNVSPNADQTAVEFWEQILLSIELRGNGYARIDRIGDRVVALTPIHPDSVSVRRTAGNALEYSWTEENGKSYRESERGILHFRGFGGNPLGGLSTLKYGAQTFGLQTAINRSASVTFRNALRPSGLLVFKARNSPAP
jgi:HK97 family phage portal protein